MSIELTVLISLISLGFAFIMGVINWRRSAKNDDRDDALQLGIILEKLSNISLGIAEVKDDLTKLTTDQADIKERLARVEASAAQAHKRIDELIKKKTV